ncbi:acyltransferase domain-containing protein, partial [Paenibacillus sp. GbtcB18]|uniref:acyltransferase domain-containing protein n=1 Tax=Paenibacillus sp. GbtcB18 TaxID=2824763 RepID=UPI001C2F20AA
GTGGLDFRRMLLGRGSEEATALKLNETRYAQPALFAVEYALAQLWMSWGIEPDVMIGYSIGEYVAACLSGVLTLEDALYLVAKRAELMDALPGGAMLAVPMGESDLLGRIGAGMSISAVNGPSMCVVAGPVADIERLEQQLAAEEHVCRRIQTSHAFHSIMMEPAREPFKALAGSVRLHPPKRSYISTVTGTWITEAEAVDPEHWANHMCQAVRFADAVQTLLEDREALLLEAGPGYTLGSLIMQRMGEQLKDAVVIPAVRHEYDRQPDTAFALSSLGKMWLEGVQVDWNSFHQGALRRRLPLPTYPFERQRYWIEPAKTSAGARSGQKSGGDKPAGKTSDMTEWFYTPSWKRIARAEEQGQTKPSESSWIVFEDESGIGSRLAERLGADEVVIRVRPGTVYHREGHVYTIDPREPSHYEDMVGAWVKEGIEPKRLVHLWSVDKPEGVGGAAFFEQVQERGFYSLLYLTQALGKQITQRLELWIVSEGVQEVTGEEELVPEKATLLGPSKVIPQEYMNITCRHVDIERRGGEKDAERIGEELLSELRAGGADRAVALRGKHRWVQSYEPVKLPEVKGTPARIRTGGVYLITGGLGKIGGILASYLAKTAGAKLVLLGRQGLPDRSQWQQWLETHGEEEETSKRIRRVEEIERHGGEVLVVQTDVSDADQMKQAVDKAIAVFGAIHGVIHAAG